MLRFRIWCSISLIIVAGKISEGVVHNVTEGDFIYNLSCLSPDIKGFLQEAWLDNIQGNNLSSLLEHQDFPDNPNRSEPVSFPTYLPEPQYGQRLRAYFAAPESGMYHFHLSCDGACVLLIESKIGSLLTRCQNASKGMNMTAGSFYYLTVLHVVSNESTYISVSVTKPNGTLLNPLPLDYLVAYKKDGILGEYIPGDWGEWSACQGGIQTRNRSCQVFPPVYSRLNSSYQLSDTKQCGKNAIAPTRPPIIKEVFQDPRHMHVIGISWSPLNVYGGLVTGYKVIFHYTNGRHHNWTLDANTSSLYVGMGANHTYCVTVLAFNEAGDGPAAKCINISTRDGACPISWTRYQDSCYFHVNKPANWSRAELECISQHSHLVTVANDEENKFVAALADNFSWIGAEWNKKNRTYLWVDGSFTDFHPEKWKNDEERSTLCVGICDSALKNLPPCDGAWHREECNQIRPYICERKVAPDPDNLECKDAGIGLEYRVRYDQIFSASSSLPDKQPHKARLAGEGAWCPETNSTEEYLEIDLGSWYRICALATQGLLGENSAFTKAYRLQFSIDGLRWDWYINETSKIFQGNQNSYAVLKREFKQIPLAQYVRIWPVEFFVHPCLRIELYGKSLKSPGGPPTSAPTNLTTVIISLTTVLVSWNSIPDYFSGGLGITGYRLYYQTKGAGAKGLEEEKSVENSKKLFNLKLNATYCVEVVGYNEEGEGPKSECTYFNTPAACLKGWSSYSGNCYRAFGLGENGGKVKWRNASVECYNHNSDLVSLYSEAENQFVKSLTEEASGTCSWIGLRSKTRDQLHWNDGSVVNFTKWKGQNLNEHECVTYDKESEYWEVKSCSSECSFSCKRKDFAWPHQSCSDMPLGLENRAIPDSAMQSTETEFNTSAYDARLSSAEGWCASASDQVYLEVDLRSPHFICGIGTQGVQRSSGIQYSGEYVRKYHVELANRDRKYELYNERGIVKEFEANTNYYRVKKNILEPGVVARYVKLQPMDWHGNPCLRLEIYGQNDSTRVPTRAPENVSFSVDDGGMLVRWSSLPVYFRGDVLGGYIVEVRTPNDSLVGKWTFSAEDKSPNFPTHTERAIIGCVMVYGFTKYGDGVSSGCVIEEQGSESGSGSESQSGSVWGSWSSWSVCSQTCGGGVSNRSREEQPCSQPCKKQKEEKKCSEQACPDSSDSTLEQSSNMITLKTSPNSVAVQWKPYTGRFNLVAYRVLVLRMRARESRKRRSTHNMEGELLRNFTVGPNVTSFEIANLSAFTKYCVRIGAITSESGDESLSDCYYLYTEKEEVSLPPPPEANATTNGSSLVTVHWKPVLNQTILGYIIFIRDTNRTITVGSCVTNITVESSGCVEIASFNTAGWGNTTGCLQAENLTTATPVSPEPVSVVNETAPKITASIRKSQTTILVRWDPKTISGVRGEIVGYNLEFKLIEADGIPKKDALWTSLIFSCHQFKTEYNLTDLLPFARYKIKMAVFTSEGVGKYSEAVYGVTCACAEFITARSISGIKDSKLDIITSTLTKVISDLLLDTCGKCEDYTTKLIYSNKSDDGNGLDFPVSKTSFGQSEYSKFVPVITVPGVFVITRKSDLGMILTQVASGSVLSSWPIAVITVVMATLAGIVIWCLDSKENSEQFPHIFVKGAGQGFWWSFISMTTVGYGDLCPKSIPGKLFAIVWFLIGLVIFSVFMGTLTSLLTVTTVKKTIGSPQGTDMKTVAVVANSPEKRVAVGSLSGKVTVGKQFPDVEHLVRALKDGAVESIMVDMYTPVKRKDLFNGSWFEIFKLLEAEISHGVLLHGETVRLVGELKKLIIAKNVQTEYLQDANADAEVEVKVLEEEPVTFFEPESPYFRTTMYTTLAALGVCLCCGMLYQAFFYKRRRAPGNNINSNVVVPKNTATAAELETAVEEFYSSFTSAYKELRKKFKAEFIQLEKIKRQRGKNLILKNFQIFESEA